MAAFRRAHEIGAHMIELDVQLTSDDAVVVLHDDTLDRTTTGLGPIGALTLARVRELDAGSWFDKKFTGEKLPTLAQALDSALSLTAERRGELALAAQEHMRGRYALAQSNARLLPFYERLSDKGG